MDNIRKVEEEYEYLEQMLSVFQQKQKKIERKFKRMESFGEINHIIEFLKLFLPANVILFLLEHKFMLELSPIDLSSYEARFFLLSYIFRRLADKSLGVDSAGRRLEKIDLEQLAVDLYNYQEKVKSYSARLTECNRQYFEAKAEEVAKIYAKR